MQIGAIGVCKSILAIHPLTMSASDTVDVEINNKSTVAGCVTARTMVALFCAAQHDDLQTQVLQIFDQQHLTTNIATPHIQVMENDEEGRNKQKQQLADSAPAPATGAVSIFLQHASYIYCKAVANSSDSDGIEDVTVEAVSTSTAMLLKLRPNVALPFATRLDELCVAAARGCTWSSNDHDHDQNKPLQNRDNLEHVSTSLLYALGKCDGPRLWNILLNYPNDGISRTGLAHALLCLVSGRIKCTNSDNIKLDNDQHELSDANSVTQLVATLCDLALVPEDSVVQSWLARVPSADKLNAVVDCASAAIEAMTIVLQFLTPSRALFARHAQIDIFVALVSWTYTSGAVELDQLLPWTTPGLVSRAQSCILQLANTLGGSKQTNLSDERIVPEASDQVITMFVSAHAKPLFKRFRECLKEEKWKTKALNETFAMLAVVKHMERHVLLDDSNSNISDASSEGAPDLLTDAFALVLPICQDLNSTAACLGLDALHSLLTLLTATQLRWHTDLVFHVLQRCLASTHAQVRAQTLECLNVALLLADPLDPAPGYGTWHYRLLVRTMEEIAMATNTQWECTLHGLRFVRRLVRRMSTSDLVPLLSKLVSALVLSARDARKVVMWGALLALRDLVGVTWVRVTGHWEAVLSAALRSYLLCVATIGEGDGGLEVANKIREEQNSRVAVDCFDVHAAIDETELLFRISALSLELVTWLSQLVDASEVTNVVERALELAAKGPWALKKDVLALLIEAAAPTNTALPSVSIE